MIALTYRYGTVQDVPAIRTLIERCYRGDEIAKDWASEAAFLKGPRTSEAQIAELVANSKCHFLLAEDGKLLVGCALLERRGDDAYFGMFSVEPLRQEGGIGKAFLAQAEAAVRKLWHSTSMTMVVISIREALIDWYGRRGYSRTGATLPFPFSGTTGETRRDFHLVELRKELV
jgi:GNAT superfamily N-acetyltransferase